LSLDKDCKASSTLEKTGSGRQALLNAQTAQGQQMLQKIAP